ncbi:MAG: hypothetical protein WC551_00460 [Patescibacteria group bacterium]
MKKKEEKILSYSLREYPALCVAMVFVGIWELEKLANRIRGIEEPPRPKASVRKQNKLIGEIFG